MEGLYGSLATLIASLTDPGSAADKVAALWASLKGMLSGIAGHATAELVSTDVAMHDHGHGHGHGHRRADDPPANDLVPRLAATASAAGLILGTVGPVATQLVTQNPFLSIGASATGLFALGAGVISQFKGQTKWASRLREGFGQLTLGAMSAGFFFGITEGIEAIANGAGVAQLTANGVLPTLVALPLTIAGARFVRRWQDRREKRRTESAHPHAVGPHHGHDHPHPVVSESERQRADVRQRVSAAPRITHTLVRGPDGKALLDRSGRPRVRVTRSAGPPSATAVAAAATGLTAGKGSEIPAGATAHLSGSSSHQRSAARLGLRLPTHGRHAKPR